MIFTRMAEDEGYTLGDGVLDAVRATMDREYLARTETFGNARFVRNLFERALTAQANRLVMTAPSRAELCAITAADLT
jgi:hypothetical protein